MGGLEDVSASLHAHLSLFQVVEDLLGVLGTHVAVLRVLRVDVKLLWDLKKVNKAK